MIKELRVDDRLIHGQIALTWPKALEVKRIVVANDKAAENKMQQMSLKMAVPTDIKVLVRSINDAITFFSDPKVKTIDIMVIVNSVADAENLADHLEIIERINIANVGRFDGVENSEKLKLNSSILLNRTEQAALEKLVASKLKLVSQIVPDSAAKDIRELVSSKNH